MKQPKPELLKAMPLGKALPKLAESRRVRKTVIQNWGKARLDSILAAMKAGTPQGELGDEIHDFFDDEISNESHTIWTGYTATDFPVSIQEYEGVYFVSSPELDDCGYFLEVADAKSYIDFNWMGEVQEDTKRNTNKKKRTR